MTRALVVCAHGTDNPQGQAVVRSIVAQVARRRPDLTVREAYVDVQQPELPQVVNELAAHHDSVVVVPLLLSSGFHTEVDVAQAVAAHPHAHAAPALGPHALLAKVLVDRLVDAGATLDASVVLAVAGSSRAAGATDAERMRELLAERWAGTVALGYLPPGSLRWPTPSGWLPQSTAATRARLSSRATSSGPASSTTGSAASVRGCRRRSATTRGWPSWCCGGSRLCSRVWTADPGADQHVG